MSHENVTVFVQGHSVSACNIGLTKDLNLSSGSYALASSTFYIATFLFGIVRGLTMKVVKPSTWLAVCMTGWDAMSAIQAACHNGAQLAAVRFLLGLFEASFAPGCALCRSFWYLKTESSLRIAAYAGTSALLGVLGGLIAYGLSLNGNSLAFQAWRAMFITEGVPTIFFRVITFFYLPDRPEVESINGFLSTNSTSCSIVELDLSRTQTEV